jgi:hypothetical protein
VPLSAKASSVVLYDAMSAKKGLANWRKGANGETEVMIQLQPFESIVVRTYTHKITGAHYDYKIPVGEAQEIKGTWTLEFVTGGPVLPAKTTLNQLGSWTDLNGEEVKNFSGTVRYSISFPKPTGNARYYLLDLGQVDETAEVILNGKKMGSLIGPVFQLSISAGSLKANNKLEVIVANLMANRISYMDRNNMPWKIFYNINMPARRAENSKNGLFDASKWKPLPSGLLGPVTLTSLK